MIVKKTVANDYYNTNFALNSKKNRRKGVPMRTRKSGFQMTLPLGRITRLEKENCPKRSAETLLIPTFMLTFFVRSFSSFLASFAVLSFLFEGTTDNGIKR